MDYQTPNAQRKASQVLIGRSAILPFLVNRGTFVFHTHFKSHSQSKRRQPHDETIFSVHVFPVDMPLDSVDGNRTNGGHTRPQPPYLPATRFNISDLTGLEHATNLTTLWIHSNSISDISPLAGLNKLTELLLTKVSTNLV